MLITALRSMSRGMRMNAPMHPLVPVPEAGGGAGGPGGNEPCRTPEACGREPGEACVCGWHESSYELRSGVEVIESESFDPAVWALWTRFA